MNLVFDVQSLQSRSEGRGIGRATREILSFIAKIKNPSDKFFALYNSSKILSDKNREFLVNLDYELIQFEPFIDSEAPSLVADQATELIKSFVVRSVCADTYIGPNIFEGYKDSYYPEPITGIYNGALYYDAIPMQFPEQYLSNPEQKQWYEDRLEIFKKYDRIFTLSESSREECIKYTKITPKKIQSLNGGFSDRIDVSDLSQKNENNFTILYLGAFDYRKNVKLAINSFAKFIEQSQSKSKLILAGHVLDYETEIAPLVRLAEKLRIKEQIEFHLNVSEFELNALYKLSDLFIQTSLAEGLGLGVLDAASRGIPSIALDIPSAREVLGDGDHFFENEIESCSDLILRIYFDIPFRSSTLNLQINNMQKLSWQRAAEILYKDIGKNGIKSKNSSRISAREEYKDLIKKIRNNNSLSKLDKGKLAFIMSLNFSHVINFPERKDFFNEFEVNSVEIQGHFSGNYSLSILNREFTNSVEQLLDNCISQEIFYDAEEDNFVKLNQDDYSETYCISRNVYPPIAHDMEGKWNFYHCFNWEETEFPEKFVMEFNYFLDGVSCASSEVQKSLIDSGVTIPTSVVSLSRQMNFTSNTIHSALVNSSSFVFLHSSSCFPRKGIDVLISAFEKEFSEDENVLLIIKTFPNPHQNVKEIISKIDNESVQTRIRVIEEDLTDNEILALYQNADCLVQPSRGEGFGLPIFEAQSLGLKVIASKWGGHNDFYVDQKNYGIEYSMEYSNSHVSTGTSLWAEPNLSSLRAQMRKVHSEGKYSFSPQPPKYSWAVSANNHVNFMNKVINKNKSDVRIAVMSTWQTKCGIAEYTHDLVRFFEGVETKIFAPYATEILDSNIEIGYSRCWTVDGENLEHLSLELQEFKPTIMIIQYNKGFFSTDQFKELVLLNPDVVKVVEIHAMRDEFGNIHEKFLAIQDSLAKVDRILVHTLEDINYLHKIGLSKQALLFPHPTPYYGYKAKHSKVSDRASWLVGTSGFSLPHKGHLELIDAIEIVNSKGYDVSLKLFTPQHPDPSSEKYLRQVKKKISSLKKSQIYLDERYQIESEIISNLTSCDLLVYSHQLTGEAASGAVQHGLSSGRPILVTPSKIFDELTHCVFKTEGYRSTEIANSIIELISKMKSDSLPKDKEDASNLLLNRNSFQKSSVRLVGICKGLLNSL